MMLNYINSTQSNMDEKWLPEDTSRYKTYDGGMAVQHQVRW